mgnify:CR=1 FL=1
MNNNTIKNVSEDFLKHTPLSDFCYYRMFFGCTSLETAPELPAASLTKGCYSYMFDGCSNLNYIKVGFTKWNDSYGIADYKSTYSWVNNIASIGTFECPKELTIQTGISYVPEGWSVTTY